MTGMSNKITGPNAGGPRQFPTRTPLAARVDQFQRSASMSRVLAIQVASFLVALTGCSDRPKQLDGYEQGKGGLGDFIVNAAPKLGVRLLATNGLPFIPGRWYYQARPGELAVILEGNCFLELDAFLTNAVGAMRGQPTPNKVTGITEAYYGTNFGATVGSRLGIADAGKQYTSFVIVGYGASPTRTEASNPTPKQVTEYWTLLLQESEKGKERFKALDHARTSAPCLQDFLRLFPEAEVNYSYWGGSSEPGYVAEVDLHGRYEFELRLPVRFDSSRRSIIGCGEPTFCLRELAMQAGRERSYNQASDRQFGTAEWRKIVESGGNFQAIGYSMVTDQPAPGYRDRKQLKEKRWEK
jgi:hypothetical protein